MSGSGETEFGRRKRACVSLGSRSFVSRSLHSVLVFLCLLCRAVSSYRNELVEKMRPLLRAAAAIPPLALRGDYWAPLTLLPYLIDAFRHAGPDVKVMVNGACFAVFSPLL